jgi:TIR domain
MDGAEATGTGSAATGRRMREQTACVFLSYRRDDAPDAVDRLYTSLAGRFGEDNVFIDIDRIDIGAPFAKIVNDWIARSDVLLAMIGRSWLGAVDDDGNRRLDDPKDYVRREIESALEREIRVVPVLIHGAKLPKEHELPSTLAPLLDRNAVELTRAYWDLDVERLGSAIDRIPLPPREASSLTETPKPAAPPSSFDASVPPTPVAPRKGVERPNASSTQRAVLRQPARAPSRTTGPRVSLSERLRRSSPLAGVAIYLGALAASSALGAWVFYAIIAYNAGKAAVYLEVALANFLPLLAWFAVMFLLGHTRTGFRATLLVALAAVLLAALAVFEPESWSVRLNELVNNVIFALPIAFGIGFVTRARGILVAASLLGAASAVAATFIVPQEWYVRPSLSYDVLYDVVVNVLTLFAVAILLSFRLRRTSAPRTPSAGGLSAA